MRWSIFLLSAASMASAAIVPRGVAKNLPASAFPSFTTISLEEAKQGKDLWDKPEGNETLHEEFSANRLATVASAASAACSSNPSVRYEWRDYPDTDRVAFIAAIKCLMGKPPSGKFAPATNRYEDLARLHQQFMPNIHGNAKFLIWHRYYVWTFEQVLRKECGFNRNMPWWDETKDAGKFSQSSMFTDSRFFGSMTGNANGSPKCVTGGAFSGMTCHIGPGNSNQNHCLSRAGDGSLTSQVNQNFVNTCNARTSYADMASCSEYGPHAYGHNGIGGVMSDVSASPSDPVFYMHHLFVDHSFRIWQNANAARTTSINGVDVNGNALSMNTGVSVGGIMPDVKIGDIMNTLSGTVIGGVPFCYRYNY